MTGRSSRFGSFLCGVVLAAGVARAADPAQAPSPATGAAPTETGAAGQAPHIKFDSEQLDLGDVVHGQDAVATFTYRNTGTVPLHILAAKPG